MNKTTRLLCSVSMAVALTACGAGQIEPAARADVAGESIGVHGSWVIAVADPDGTVVDELAFHNEFIGQEALAAILTGAESGGGWVISLSGDTPLCNAADFRCSFHGSATIGEDGASVVVSRNIEVSQAGEISLVEAQVTTSDGARAPFSQKLMATSDGGPGVVLVEAGQIVQVEVRYTFG